MVNKSCSYSLEARPNQLLIDHLRSTARYCSEIRQLKFTGKQGISSDLLGDVSYLIGYTHDLGKATSFFQEYVKETDKVRQARLKNKDETRHSLLSSLFTYRIILDHIKQRGLSNHPICKYLPILSFLVVKRHHGNPKNLRDEIISLGGYSNTLSIVTKQIASINANEFDGILKEGPDIRISLDDFAKEVRDLVVRQIMKDEKKNWRQYSKNSGLDAYFIFQLLYSSLLSADKRDAIGIGQSHETPVIDSNLIDKYRHIKFKNQLSENLINPIRDMIYSEMSTSVKKLDLKNRVFSINVPTGTGKTLTGLSFALKLRDRIFKEERFIPKIIYCLPFLSIIEQNYSVFENVFKEVKHIEPGNNVLLKHHHLSEIAYRFREDEVSTTDESQYLIEGWKSEIVVTTFMQLFHTMISNNNRMLRKFNEMINAIIILDEIQTVPYKYWGLIRKLFLEFSDFFNTRFILMTATQPLIFSQEEIVEVIPPESKKYYFEKLDRISFVNRTQMPLALSDFRELIKEDILEYPEDDFLIVLNTINCSIELFNDLRNFQKQQGLNNTELYYLSTNIIPRHRLERINRIKKSKMRKIIVSTQLVEAGVDIDVERVYRDFAPFDSLNQVSGRCNRNFSGAKKGVVTVFLIKNSKPYYSYIYGKGDLSISKTKDVLKEHMEISEKGFLELGNKYFESLIGAAADTTSENILIMLSKLDFEDVCQSSNDKFALIESEYPTADLFIEIDERAEYVWKQFKETRHIKDPFKRKRKMNIIKKEFYNNVISIPSKITSGEEFGSSKVIYISKEQLPVIYDKYTGFIRTAQEQYIF